MPIVVNRTYEKEVTKDQLLHAVLEFISHVDYRQDPRVIMRQLESMLTYIVTVPWAKVWLVEEGKYCRYEDEYIAQKIAPEKGIMGHVLETKEAILVNVVAKNELYDPTVDNCDDLAFKDMIVIPIKDDQNSIIVMVQLATFMTNLQQLTDSDLKVVCELEPYIAKLYHSSLQYLDDEKPDPTMNAPINTPERVTENVSVSQREKHFYAKLIHSLQHPFNALHECMDRLKNDPTHTLSPSCLEDAQKNSTMIMQTLTNASDFLAIEQGELVLEEGEFSPIEAFGTIESFFCDTIQRANLSFYLFIDPNLPKMIFSDSKRIRQILFNLIDNAIKFTPSNGIITIEVTYEPRDCVMIFSVEDNGIGISLEDQKTLFEPYNGRGLGLPLSFSLAKLLDSECKVRSKKDEGSRFYFSLPLSGKIRDESFSFDLALLVTFRPILIFDPIHFLIRKLLLRYLKSFGCPIENIMVLTTWKQIEGIKPTHILCDAQSLHSKWIQPLLDTGVRLIVIDSTLSPIESLKGDISSLRCTFDVMQLYSVLKNGSLSNGSLLNKTASEIALRGHLLIVDSNAINSKFLHEMGTKLGFKVLTALNEQDAILMYSDAIEKKSPFDLILMDEIMDGVEIATSILKFEEEYGLDHTPIVSINRNVPTEKNQSPRVGIDQQIFEPITIKKLSELFEHILSLKS